MQEAAAAHTATPFGGQPAAPFGGQPAAAQKPKLPPAFGGGQAPAAAPVQPAFGGAFGGAPAAGGSKLRGAAAAFKMPAVPAKALVVAFDTGTPWPAQQQQQQLPPQQPSRPMVGVMASHGLQTKPGGGTGGGIGGQGSGIGGQPQQAARVVGAKPGGLRLELPATSAQPSGPVGSSTQPAYTVIKQVIKQGKKMVIGTSQALCPDDECEDMAGIWTQAASTEQQKTQHECDVLFEGKKSKASKKAEAAYQEDVNGLKLVPVKKWRRAAAGIFITPEIVRTPACLIESMDYLCSDRVLDRTLDMVSNEVKHSISQADDAFGRPLTNPLTDESLALDKQCYCADRMKQVANDCAVQGMVAQGAWEAVVCLEAVVRYSIMCDYEMQENEFWDREVSVPAQCSNPLVVHTPG